MLSNYQPMLAGLLAEHTQQLHPQKDCLASSASHDCRRPRPSRPLPSRGASPVPAAIAVAFHTSGALGKLFSEVNENIDVKPLEGLKATGSTWLQRVRFGVIPQVLPNYSSYFLLRFEINVRASAILGFVGAGGIGSELSRAIGWGAGAEIAALFLMLFLSIVAIDQLSSYLRRHFVGAENFA